MAKTGVRAVGGCLGAAGEPEEGTELEAQRGRQWCAIHPIDPSSTRTPGRDNAPSKPRAGGSGRLAARRFWRPAAGSWPKGPTARSKPGRAWTRPIRSCMPRATPTSGSFVDRRPVTNIPDCSAKAKASFHRKNRSGPGWDLHRTNAREHRAKQNRARGPRRGNFLNGEAVRRKRAPAAPYLPTHPSSPTAGESSTGLVGSARVRRHSHRRARSAPQCGVSRGPRACRVRVPVVIRRRSPPGPGFRVPRCR